MSRGLGDVYKRQVHYPYLSKVAGSLEMPSPSEEIQVLLGNHSYSCSARVIKNAYILNNDK